MNLAINDSNDSKAMIMRTLSNTSKDDMRERYKMIGHIKEDISTSKLCSGINREFGTYLRYVRGLKFSDRPDYNYLKNLFRHCLQARDQQF